MSKEKCEGCLAPKRCGVREHDVATDETTHVACYRTLAQLPDASTRPIVLIPGKVKG